MHIKIVLPTNYDREGQPFKVKKATLPNLTLRYLAGMVPAPHTVSVLEECLHDVDFDEPVDLVAISVLTSNAQRAYEIGDEFRKRGVRVVMGGIHITCCPEEAMAHADAVVQGEAEDVWPEVIRDCEKGQLRSRYQATPRDSLSGLARPRYDLIDPADYFSVPFVNSRIMPIQTSRGCPHDCDFCIVTKFFGAKMRHRPIEDVVQEMKASGSKVFFFTDDNFFSSYQRAEDLCRAIQPLNIKFVCQLDTLSYKRPELVKLLAESGCFLAFIGFESISQDNLKSVNKGFNKAASFEKLFEVFDANGIGIYASIIFGFDHDTPETVNETVRFLVEHQANLAAFFPLTPSPSTALYKRMRDEGRLYADAWWLSRDPLTRHVRIKYSEDQYSGLDLVGRAMKDFYSLGSISKRLLLPPRNSFGRSTMFLSLNLAIRQKVKKSPMYFM